MEMWLLAPVVIEAEKSNDYPPIHEEPEKLIAHPKYKGLWTREIYSIIMRLRPKTWGSLVQVCVQNPEDLESMNHVWLVHFVSFWGQSDCWNTIPKQRSAFHSMLPLPIFYPSVCFLWCFSFLTHGTCTFSLCWFVQLCPLSPQETVI